jgi:hypothetical protein
MERDKPDDNTMGLSALTIFRGLYNRVAVKLGVDPSYVSRVARGERRSPTVFAALEEEMAVIREYLNNHVNGKQAVNSAGRLDGRDAADGFANRNGKHNGNHNGNHNDNGVSGNKEAGSANRMKSARPAE